MQDALEAAVEGDDKDKLEQHLQANEAQACLLLHQIFIVDDCLFNSLSTCCFLGSGTY